MTEILRVESAYHIEEAQRLIRAFVEWHRNRHIQDLKLIDQYFDSKEFEEELKNLKSKYAQPKGQLLLALHDGNPAGCVALKELEKGICEMKRMFVYPQFHGKGIGRALAVRIIDEARKMGFSLMRLDTSFRQTEAQTLYRSMGFKDIKPYYELPENLKNWLVFMELEL